MANPLSTDLRSRVVAAVEEWMSRHAAAARFGVQRDPLGAGLVQ